MKNILTLLFMALLCSACAKQTGYERLTKYVDADLNLDYQDVEISAKEVSGYKYVVLYSKFKASTDELDRLVEALGVTESFDGDAIVTAKVQDAPFWDPPQSLEEQMALENRFSLRKKSKSGDLEERVVLLYVDGVCYLYKAGYF